jgi:hypothetical protein
MVALDARDIHKYMVPRRMPEILPGGVSFKDVQRMFDRPLVAYARKTLSARAARQAQLDQNWPVKRLTNADHRIIGDYISVRDAQTFFSHRNGAYTLPRRAFDLDTHAVVKQQLRDVPRFATKLFGPPAFKQPTRPAVPKLQTTFDSASYDESYPEVRPLDGLAHITQMRKRPRAQQDSVCHDHNIFVSQDTLRSGNFFSTPLFEATLEPMSDNDFGQVDLSTQPFQITLNSRMAYPRVRMSMVHEMLHVLLEMHKINLPHSMLHEVAVLIVNDVLPALGALAEHTERAER